VTKKKTEKIKSELERDFETYWRICAPSGPEPQWEYEFHPMRRWKFDVAFPSENGGGVAVELQGKTWQQGRHTRGYGYRADCEKLAEAQLLGWVVFYVTSGMLEDDPQKIVDWILTAMGVGDD
jgi:hypothetical protein